MNLSYQQGNSVVIILTIIYNYNRGICSNRANDLVKERLDAYFKPIAAAYKDICDKQIELRKSFFGLRDFYR